MRAGTRFSWIIWLQDGGECSLGGKESWHTGAAAAGDPVAIFNIANVLSAAATADTDGGDFSAAHDMCPLHPTNHLLHNTHGTRI